MKIRYSPIGIIHSPFKDVKEMPMPIQSSAAEDITGIVEVKKKYREALNDLDGFSYIILLYHFHLAKGYSLKVRPFLDDKLRGVFATRAPRRPNPIGISVVRLIKVENCKLFIEGVDMVDNTPLLDIKPYVPEFDVKKKAQIGWLSKKVHKVYKTKADDRLEK